MYDFGMSFTHTNTNTNTTMRPNTVDSTAADKKDLIEKKIPTHK